MKKLFCILIIYIVNSFSQEIDSYKFFPSAIGNHWEYSLEDGYLMKYTIIRDSTDKFGNKFLFFYEPSKNQEPDYKIDINYNVYYAPTHDHLNMLFYKLDADTGDSWWVTIPDSNGGQKAILTDIYQGNVLGKSTTIKRIEYYRLFEGDTTINQGDHYLTTRELAYGIGLIFEDQDATQPMILIGCIINGDTLGYITNIFNYSKLSHMPNRLFLKQNYPNPFNISTVIEYFLPSSGKVDLSIYNILGEKVFNIHKGYFKSGIYKVSLNKYGKLKHLTTGIYFYRLNFRSESICKKLLIIK